MIAHVTQLRPRRFIHIVGDAHIYNTHTDQVKRQMGRTPRDRFLDLRLGIPRVSMRLTILNLIVS